MDTENKITNGVIWKEVLHFFIPIIIGAFFQHLYTIVDTIIVGRSLGTIELSAVGGSASKLIVMITNFFIGVSSGITVYVSRAYGQKDFKQLKHIAFNGLILFFGLGLLLSIIGINFSREFLTLLKTPEDTLLLSNLYLKTYLWGIVFCVLYNTLTGILRAMGDSKRPLIVLIFCSFLNIFLDVLFVLYFKMGIFGVALATVIAQTISAIVVGRILYKALKASSVSYRLNFDSKVMLDISRIGIPAGLQSMMFSLSNMVVQSGVNSFGTLSVAAWSVYVKLDSIVDIFLSSLSNTVITFVGQNLGAKKIDRVKDSVKQITILSYIMIFALVMIFITLRTGLFSLFTRDLGVISLGSSIMCVILPMYLLAIPQQICSQALRGLGVSFLPMIFTLVGVVGIRVIWVYFVLPLNPNLLLLAACYPLSAIIMSTIFIVYYKHEIKNWDNKAA